MFDSAPRMHPLMRVGRNPLVLSLACAAAAAMVFISEGSYQQSQATLNGLDAGGAARARIQGLQQSILDAETGQRGYLLTGRRETLAPYERSVKDIEATLVFLAARYGNEPGMVDPLTRLRLLTQAKLADLAETIGRRNAGPGSAARDMLVTDLGREQMNAINAAATELIDEEARRALAGRGELSRTLVLSRVGVSALSALSLAALFLFLRQAAALKLQQLGLKRVVQDERDRLDVEVKKRTAQLTELTHHLQTAREDERRRLARNLHDELGALLTSAKLDAARIRSRLGSTAPEALERLAHLVDTLNQSIALGRSIIEDLHPSTLNNLGLVTTLEILVRDFSERSAVTVHCTLVPVPLDPSAELTVYRLVQEAVTNISKYARARNLWLTLATHEGRVEVAVRDDGAGFDTGREASSAYGLVGMRFRVEAEGGRLDVVSSPGQGTLVRATLPVAEPDVEVHAG